MTLTPSEGTGGESILYSTNLGISLKGKQRPKPKASTPEKSVKRALSAVRTTLLMGPHRSNYVVSKEIRV